MLSVGETDNLFNNILFSLFNSMFCTSDKYFPSKVPRTTKAGIIKERSQSGIVDKKLLLGDLYKPLLEIMLIQSFKKLIIFSFFSLDLISVKCILKCSD